MLFFWVLTSLPAIIHFRLERGPQALLVWAMFLIGGPVTLILWVMYLITLLPWEKTL